MQYACNNKLLPLRSQLRRWVRAALDGSIEETTVTIRFVDAEEGRELNRDYRGKGKDKGKKDYATNVLSFPYAPPPRLAGDLVLCLPVVLREAAEQGKPATAHLAHLVVHGMLHLQGYDHEMDADAHRMEDKERTILGRFGIADPYQAERE